MTPEELKAKRAKLHATFSRVFGSPDGKIIMDELNARFNYSTLKRRDGVIDPYASIASAGSREVLLYIEQMRKNNAITE